MASHTCIALTALPLPPHLFTQLGMGITLTLDEITTVFVKQPQLLLLGMVLQYSVLPCIGYLLSRNWGLTEGLAVGVALVSCMPGMPIQSLSSAAAAAANQCYKQGG